MRRAPQQTRTYHITAVTAQRRPIFRTAATAELFQQTLFDYHQQGKFQLHAFVIMPDHFHAILTPAPDVSLEKSVQLIKGGFSFRLKSKLDLWMHSFNETQIQTSEQFEECKRYIEANPVRKRIAETPEAYPFSSVCNTIDPMPQHLSAFASRP